MKKIILFAAFAVVAFATQAQVKFGAKAGLNLSTWTGDAKDLLGDVKMKPGFYIGGLANISVSENFSIQPELLFSAEGTKTTEGMTVNYNTMFINVPVVAQYKTASGFYVEAGPQLGLLVSAKAKAEGEDDVDIKDDLQSTNFSAVLGLGYTMASGFGFGGRYNLGLSNALKDAGDLKVKTSNFSIGVHYIFGGKSSKK